jgi:DNA-directed RNA polymerase specialized sigma24 family protein
MRVMPGELHALLERCRADDGAAWERFAGWVTTRGRAILGGVDRLSDADGEDAVAETLKSLVAVVRRGEIRGASNAEIDAYVCTAIRRRALNVLRGRARRREVVDHRHARRDSRRHPRQGAQPRPPNSWTARRRSTVVACGGPLPVHRQAQRRVGVIRQTLGSPIRPPSLSPPSTRFHRLRQRLLDEVADP